MIKPQAAIAELRECVEKHCADCEATIASLREEIEGYKVAARDLNRWMNEARERVRVLEGALRNLLDDKSVTYAVRANVAREALNEQSSITKQEA